MVLADLGIKLRATLSKIANGPVTQPLLDAILKDICVALMESDVNVARVQALRAQIRSTIDIESHQGNAKKHVQKVVFDALCGLVDPGVEGWKPVKGKPNVVMFVGLQGAGKTTTCTKLGAHYLKKGWKVSLVCTDTFRAGAYDQLKQNATKARIPFYGSYTESDPVLLALEGTQKFKKEQFEIILIDTSGRHKQELDLFLEMKQISEAVKPDAVIYVMDGNIGQAAEGHSRAFKEAVDVGSVVLTKMDGGARGGGAISAVAATGSPILFIGTGEHLTDLETFQPKKYVSKLLGMGDLSGFIESMQEMTLAPSSTLLENMEKGKFTLKDMRDQLQMISSMGPLSNILSMMPGLPPDLINAADSSAGTSKMKQYMYIFDSMTAKELASDASLFKQEGRIQRVAKGSGCRVRDVEALLGQCDMFGGMVKQIGGSDGLMKNMEKNMKNGNGANDPMAGLQDMMKGMMPKGMMDQLGGMDIGKMMENMGGMDGIQQMMQGMGGMFGGNPAIKPKKK